MSQWGSAPARRVLAALLRIGWAEKRRAGGSHRVLSRQGWPIGELEIFLTQNDGRPLFYNSTRFAATTIGFQHVRVGGVTAWHNPPQRWLAFILVGTWEIEASDGSRRRFPPGSVSLVEDTTGKGHRGWAVGDADVLVASVSLPRETVIA